jgi:hypothetical protein
MEVAGSPGPGPGDPPERRGQCPAFGTWGEATMTVAIIATMRDLASVPAGRTAHCWSLARRGYLSIETMLYNSFRNDQEQAQSELPRRAAEAVSIELANESGVQQSSSSARRIALAVLSALAVAAILTVVWGRSGRSLAHDSQWSGTVLRD